MQRMRIVLSVWALAASCAVQLSHTQAAQPGDPGTKASALQTRVIE